MRARHHRGNICASWSKFVGCSCSQGGTKSVVGVTADSRKSRSTPKKRTSSKSSWKQSTRCLIFCSTSPMLSHEIQHAPQEGLFNEHTHTKSFREKSWLTPTLCAEARVGQSNIVKAIGIYMIPCPVPHRRNLSPFQSHLKGAASTIQLLVQDQLCVGRLSSPRPSPNRQLAFACVVSFDQ